MKLAYNSIEPVIILDENTPFVLSLESPKLFRDFLCDFQNQMDIGEGRFTLSENDKIVQLHKSVDFLLDPTNTDINQRKILQKLYASLDKESNDAELFEETLKIKSYINKFLLDLEYESEYILEHDVDFDLKGLFSATNLRFVQERSDFLARLAKYVEISRKFLGFKALVLVNIRSYLSSEEIKLLWDAAAYNKMAILMIESNYIDKIAEEKLTIIDKDLCVVYNDNE